MLLYKLQYVLNEMEHNGLVVKQFIKYSKPKKEEEKVFNSRVSCWLKETIYKGRLGNGGEGIFLADGEGNFPWTFFMDHFKVLFWNLQGFLLSLYKYVCFGFRWSLNDIWDKLHDFFHFCINLTTYPYLQDNAYPTDSQTLFWKTITCGYDWKESRPRSWDTFQLSGSYNKHAMIYSISIWIKKMSKFDFRSKSGNSGFLDNAIMMYILYIF